MGKDYITKALITLVAGFVIWTNLSGISNAAPALPEPIQIEQPSGVDFEARLYGDEWENWVATAEDNVVVEAEDGYWKYAELAYGELQASQAVVGVDTVPENVVKNSEWKVQIQQFSEAPKVPTFYYSSGTAPQGAVALQPTGGPQKVLVLLVGFNNVNIRYPEAAWSNQFFGSSGKTVKTYYQENSGGSFYFTPAAETGGTANDGVVKVSLNYNHPNTGSNTGSANQKLVRDALLAADPYVNYASFDTNGNGYIDFNELHIVTIVAGYERSSGTVTPNVWGHRWALFGTQSAPQLDGKYVGASGHGGYTQQGEVHSNEGDHMATIGILSHELGHDIGLFDEYNTDNSSDPSIGGSSLMASGSWGRTSINGDYSGGTPTHIGPWGKIFLGFVNPTVVTNGIHTLNSAATGQYSVLKINTTNPDEYFLVENRNFSGFDAGLYKDGVYSDSIFNGGIAIWHIDEAVIAAKTYANTVNNNPSHRGTNVEFAMSRNEPYYRVGSAAMFTDTTTPNSRLYSGSSSNLTLAVLDGTGPAMRVQVGGQMTNFHFESPTYSSNENAGTLSLTVKRAGDASEAMSVDYQTANETATAGVDYTATAGTLNFAPGETSKTIDLPIIDDALVESAETLTVTLSNATNGGLIGSPSTATVTIIENDTFPVVKLSAADYSVTEGSAATITVLRTGNTGISSSIRYDTYNGTAFAGQD